MKDIFGDDDSTKNDSDLFAQMLKAADGQIQGKLQVGDKIVAEVLSISKDEVYVATGMLVDGMVYRRELCDEQGQLKYKVGDKVELFVTQVKSDFVRLSKTASQKEVSENLEDAFDFMLPVEGRVTEVCNGGFRVNILGKTAFCPISQIDTKFVDKAEEYLNKKYIFLITQFEKSGKNIVVSRRRILEQEQEESMSHFVDTQKVGDVIQGTVTRIEKFGAFVEIAPGLEGMAHISEISWSRLDHPSEEVKIGQTVSVKILKVEDNQGKSRIAVSIKQATQEPWANLPAHVRVGEILSGKVTRCAPFGAFVEVLPGIEGLIPLSEMSYKKRVVKSDDLIKPGQVVAVMIKEVRHEERRMSLSLKDAEGDPWAQVHTKYPLGKSFQGKIERKEKYGLFINLEPGITGLLPKSKLSGLDINIENKKIGELLVVQIDEINLAERKISLGMPKDPEDTSWQAFSGKSESFGTFGDAFKVSLSPQSNSPESKAQRKDG